MTTTHDHSADNYTHERVDTVLGYSIGYDEWVSDDQIVTIQQEHAPHAPYTVVVMLSEHIVVGPYPGSPDVRETTLLEAECPSFEYAHAAAQGVLAELARVEAEIAADEDRYAAEYVEEAKYDMEGFQR